MNETLDVELLEPNVLLSPNSKHSRYEELVKAVKERLNNEIAIRKFVVGEDGFRVTKELKEGLEERTNRFFFDEGEQLVSNYKSSHLWNNFRYMLSLVNPNKPFIPQMNNYESIIGLLLGHRTTTPTGIPYFLYDTIGIDKEYRGNGYLGDMMQFASVINTELTRREYLSQEVLTLPSGLRTTNKQADEQYSKRSDYRILKTFKDENHGEIEFKVHVYGFKDPVTRKAIRDYWIADGIATHIASLPPKFQHF